GNQPGEREDGNPLLRVGRHYPPLLTNTATTDTPASNSSESLYPAEQEERSQTTDRSLDASLRRNLWHICTNFLSFFPLPTKHR
ncbi:hypothetical protein LDENG_00042910, partial [Lucifuga dentata]